jgi:hypothetical protein
MNDKLLIALLAVLQTQPNFVGATVIVHTRKEDNDGKGVNNFQYHSNGNSPIIDEFHKCAMVVIKKAIKQAKQKAIENQETN